MQNFVHKPLPEPGPDASSREIRVMTLCCGKPGAEIHVKLENQVVRSGLNDNQQIAEDLRWEALSYTWGEETQPRRNICVDTLEGPQTFEVRENLFVALECLRHEDKNRRLWIDAICMDQADTEQARKEKAWQIPIMHEIYSAASITPIWLGDTGDDSDYAIAFLKALGQSFLFDHITYEARIKQTGVPARILQLHEDWSRFTWSTREHKAICALFDRDWFGRVWIRQEVFAASNSGVIMCGSASMDISDFRNAIQYLSARGLDVSDPDHVRHLDRLTLVLSVCQREYSSIYNIMDRIRVSQCRDPQDKIYGCLGMIKIAAGSAFASSIPTNYPPTSQLFQEFFLRYFHHFGTVRLLRDAGIAQNSALGAPSWVPDWLTAGPTKLDLSFECAASHGLRAEADYIEPDILRVKGCFAAGITNVRALKPVKELSSDKFHDVYAELASMVRTHVDPGNMTQLEAFTRALCCPLNALRVPLESLPNKRKDIFNFVRILSRSDDFNALAAQPLLDQRSLHDFQSCIRFIMQQRLPFIFTDDGHVGIGVDGVQPGDVVTVVLGTTNLFLLRPATREGYHRLVGSCFMHGYNWGETLLGPLPAGVTVEPRLDPKRGVYNPHYVESTTGDCTFWDPRLNWSALTLAKGEAAWTINAPGEGPAMKVPTSTYFEEHHNCKIVDILLI